MIKMEDWTIRFARLKEGGQPSFEARTKRLPKARSLLFTIPAEHPANFFVKYFSST